MQQRSRRAPGRGRSDSCVGGMTCRRSREILPGRPVCVLGTTGAEAWRYRDSQGRLLALAEGRLVGDGGKVLQNDGLAVGEIEVRGPWVENALMAHPAVVEAAVVGVPDDRWGERPFAAVVLHEGASVGPAELREFLSSKVARWQLPERWSFIAEVPRTSVGKFAKRRLREGYAKGEYKVIEYGSHG